MKFGAHVSIAGGIFNAPIRARELQCECFQIFTRSPRGGKPPIIDTDLLDKFFDNCDQAEIDDYYVHTPYFINLSSNDPKLRENSITLVREELERSSKLKVNYVMTHIGSAKEIEREKAIDLVVNSLKKILGNYDGYSKLLLENTAGQGNTIGIEFEEIAKILDRVDYEDLGVCIDTAHMFASGYDLRTKKDIDDLVKIISDTISLEKVKLIHGNDSKADFNSNKDRHEHIGKGKIGIDGFKYIIKNKYLSKLDMIVETPVDNVLDDIKTLKKLRDK